jgi:hypothetical protein
MRALLGARFLVAACAAAAGWRSGALMAQQPGRCVACHQTLPEVSQAGHGFAAWRQSRHAEAAVGCEACHGGDPAVADRERAHHGVVASGNRNSPLFYTRIPSTCGRCHAAELGYFRRSSHSTRLERDGRGPNCVTCHGAMATSVLSAERVLATCSACHAPGGTAPEDKARESAPVLRLVRTETLLHEVVSAVAAQAPARRRLNAQRLLASAERHLRTAAEVWHSFQLDSAAGRLGAAQADVLGAWAALGYSAPRDNRAPSPAAERRP